MRRKACASIAAACALDLARLYSHSGMVDTSLTLLASLAPRVRHRMLRRVRGLQWRITLSFYHAWRWFEALWQELRGEEDPGAGVLAPAEAALERAGLGPGT